MDRSIFYKEIQPKASEYSESAPQRTSIPWLIALICSTLLLQEEVKVGVVGIIVHVMASDFTLLVPLRSPSAYENTKRGHRLCFFCLFTRISFR